MDGDVDVIATVELGRVHGDATGPQAVHRGHDEVEPGVRRTEMFETARRPQPVEAVQVARDLGHVDRLERHQMCEAVVGTYRRSAQRVQLRCVLATRAPCPGLLARLVGGDHDDPERGEGGHDRFAPDAEAEHTLAVAKHVMAIERLHDVAPFPGLAVVDVALVEKIEPAEVRSVTGVSAGCDL